MRANIDRLDKFHLVSVLRSLKYAQVVVARKHDGLCAVVRFQTTYSAIEVFKPIWKMVEENCPRLTARAIEQEAQRRVTTKQASTRRAAELQHQRGFHPLGAHESHDNFTYEQQLILLQDEVENGGDIFLNKVILFD